MMSNGSTWWKDAVVYQIYPRSFSDSNGDGIGDIPGIISKLDYLKELGIDVIWLCPVYASPNVDGGYDISDYHAIAPEFGTMGDFDRLLERAHTLGIKIIMDLVVNHTSDRHEWFVESKSSKDNPKRNWYIWRDGFEGKEPNRTGSIFSGPAWEFDPLTKQYYLHMFAKQQPDLNWENPDVRSAVFDVMRWWLDKGIDGFRMDVINFISKQPELLVSDGGAGASSINGPKVCEYLDEMRREVLSKYDIMTVGETPGVTPEDAIKYCGFDFGALSMVFQFEHTDVDAGEHGKWTTDRYALPALKRIFSKWQTELEDKAWNSLFWGNHDQPRAASRFGDTASSELWEKSAKMLATCQMMMKGTPYIYQGDEIGMTNLDICSLDDVRDIETFNAYKELVEYRQIYTHDEMMACIRKAGRDNARSPVQWNSGDNAGFSSRTPWIRVNSNYRDINAEAQIANPDSIFNYYKKLIQLRKRLPVILDGRYELLLPEHDKLYAFRRVGSNGTILVLCNFSADHLTDVDIAALLPAGSGLILSNYDEISESIRAYETRVYGTQ